MAKKKTKATEPTSARRSEIIEQCTVYAQSMAAYKAGFYTDPTGDFDYAGSGDRQLGAKHVEKARRTLLRLIAISEEKRPLSADELFALTRVLTLLQETDARTNPQKEESDYVEMFAKNVARFLKPKLECPK
jgi:hypothetical protein